MNIIVFGNTIGRARNKLDEILGELKYKEVKQVKKSKSGYTIELNDGTFYRTVSASNNARGYKCEKAFIDYNIDIEIIQNVIEPCLSISKLPIEERIKYY